VICAPIKLRHSYVSHHGSSELLRHGPNSQHTHATHTCITRCSSSTTAHAISPDIAVPISSSAATANCRLCRLFNFHGSRDIKLDIGSCCLLLVRRCCRFWVCFFCSFCWEGVGSGGHASALTGDPSKQGCPNPASVAIRPNPAASHTNTSRRKRY
jgi:hypothetical protein